MVIFCKSFYINILIPEKRIQIFKTVKRERQDTAASIPLATVMKSTRLLAFLIVCNVVAAIYDANIVDKHPEDKNNWILGMSTNNWRQNAITGNQRNIFRKNVKTDTGKIDSQRTHSILKRMMKQNGLQGLKSNSLFTPYKIQDQQLEERKTKSLQKGKFMIMANIWNRIKNMITY